MPVSCGPLFQARAVAEGELCRGTGVLKDHGSSANVNLGPSF